MEEEEVIIIKHILISNDPDGFLISGNRDVQNRLMDVTV